MYIRENYFFLDSFMFEVTYLAEKLSSDLPLVLGLNGVKYGAK